MPKKCICEICTCGRHRCPHRPHDGVLYKTDEPCHLSEYKQTYNSKPIVPMESFKPKQEALRSGDPLEKDTTHKLDYIKHPLEKPHIHNPDPYIKPQGDMEGLTSYNKEYIAKRGTPAKAVRHEAPRQNLAEFKGNPTYLDDYRKWDIQRRTPCGADAHWMPPTERFDGETTVLRDYTAKYQPPRQSMRPKETNRTSSQPFDDRTGYRDFYIAHQLPKKEQRIMEQYKPPSQPMEELTNYHNDYRGNLGEKTKSFKPAGEAFQSNADFVDNTTFKDDYKAWQAKPRSAIPREEYQRPAGDFDPTTSYQKSYVPMPIERMVGQRPRSATKVSSGPFEGNTTHHDDFKKWDIDRVYPKAKDQHVPNSAPFEGLSTQKAHYVPHQYQLSKSFKPDGKAFQSDSPFNGDTMYRAEYTAKQVGLCPASLLQTQRSNYAFHRVNSRGHQEYRSLGESITPLDISQNKRMEAMSYA